MTDTTLDSLQRVFDTMHLVPVPQISELEEAMINLEIRSLEVPGLPLPPPMITVTDFSCNDSPSASQDTTDDDLRVARSDQWILNCLEQPYGPPSSRPRIAQSAWLVPADFFNVPRSPGLCRKPLPIPEFVYGSTVHFTSNDEPGIHVCQFLWNEAILDYGDMFIPRVADAESPRWLFMWPGHQTQSRWMIDLEPPTTYRELAGFICRYLAIFLDKLNTRPSSDSDPANEHCAVPTNGSSIQLSQVWLMSFGCVDPVENHWTAEFEVEYNPVKCN